MQIRTRSCPGSGPGVTGVRTWCGPGPKGPARTNLRGVDGYAIDSMFFPTTSIVCWKSAVGLNSTSSVPGKISGVWPGPT